MRKFTDDKGRDWDISVSVWTLKRVRESCGVLLTTLLEENAKLFADLFTDPVLLCDIAWVLVEDQAKDRQVDVRDFCLGVMGDSLGNMRNAVLESTVDFFDDPVTRENHREAMTKYLEIAHKINDRAGKVLAKLDTESMALKVSDSVLSSLESLESRRGLTPSAN